MEENRTSTTILTEAADQLLGQLKFHEDEVKRLRAMVKDLRARLGLRARASRGGGKRRRGAPQVASGNGADVSHGM